MFDSKAFISAVMTAALIFCLVSGAAGQEGSKSEVSTKGLLGYWKFDEGRGDIAGDGSGNGNDADIWDAEWVKGKFGTALYFNGQDSYVWVPGIEGLDGSDELTVEAWVYWEGTGRYPNIISGGRWNPGGFLIFVSDNSCSFRMGRPGPTAWNRADWRETAALLVGRFSLGRWYHLAAIFKRPEITTYVDGKRVSGAKWDFPVGFAGDLLIGRWGGKICHKGLIDEVMIFNRALSPEEVLAHYRKEADARVSAVAAGRKPYERVPGAARVTPPAFTFENSLARIGFDKRGRCTSVVLKDSGKDWVAKPVRPSIVTKNGARYRATGCFLRDGKLRLTFGRSKVEAVVAVTVKDKYFIFELVSLSGNDVAEVTFLALGVAPSKYLSSSSGMAADDDVAVAVRALNLQTLCRVSGGPTLLRAWCTDKHGLKGAKALLLACPAKEIRSVFKEAVKAEGLPYSPLGGPFAMDARENHESYIFASVSEENVDDWIRLARRSGIKYIHFSGWWQNLGHYQPREKLFPHGIEGMKSVVAKIHAAGLKAGMHILTGCITPRDPWASPVPDKRLATDADFTLAADISEGDKTVLVTEPPGNLDTIWAYASHGNAIRIGDELIQYSALSQEPPYGFLNCRRGAFGTKAAPHRKGAAVRHMYVRYGSFHPESDSTLVGEVADAIANVFNTCGFDLIYMDGAEGMPDSWYGASKMRTAIYERIKRPVRVESSWSGLHHCWPFHSCVGAWDHPKWGLNDFTDAHCRHIVNYRATSLLPAQLGWWAILGPTRDHRAEMPEEIEYLCCKAIGYDASLSFQSVYPGPRSANARQREYLTTIGRYERLRLAGYFNETVKERLREEGRQFRLGRDDDGEWYFLPTDYAAHKVTSLHNGTSKWTVENRFAAQPVKLRIEALYSVEPYDSADALVLADFTKEGEFGSPTAAARVTHSLVPSTEQVKTGKASGRFTAKSTRDSRTGAWAAVAKEFSPPVDMRQYDALGVWVHGDGKGEVLNLQLMNPKQYWRVRDEHYIKVDFTGWRYFELPLRERDSDAYADYKWPYRGSSDVYRSPLVRHAVSRLTLYFNNLPPGESVACYLSPIKALRTRKVTLRNPSISIGGKKMTVPVALESGSFIELESMDDCRLYNERCALVERLRPEGQLPTVAAGTNEVAFTCDGPKGYSARAEVTVITCGEPLRGRAPEKDVNARYLRSEYDMPRTILALDGRQEKWQTFCRKCEKPPRVEIEIEVQESGPAAASYDSPEALTLESFDDLAGFADSPENQYAKYVYDSEHKGIAAKPGVTRKLERATDVVKAGKSSARYTAANSRKSGGWCAKGRRFAPPLDISRFKGIGCWIHGDGKGEFLKLQLRDTSGAWHDMVTRIDFSGWRYVEFSLANAKLDLGKIEYLIIFFNSIPAGQTVTCYVDDVRVLPEPPALEGPTLTIGDRRIVFPVSLSAGDRVIYAGPDDCRLYRAGTKTATQVRPEGEPPTLKPGFNPVTFGLGPKAPRPFRLTVSLAKVYE